MRVARPTEGLKKNNTYETRMTFIAESTPIEQGYGRLVSITMYVVRAMMTRYRWAEGIPRMTSTARAEPPPYEINAHVSVTEACLDLGRYQLYFDLEHARGLLAKKHVIHE